MSLRLSLRLIQPASRLLSLLTSQCAVCHSWPAHRVCRSCVARFAQALPRCRTCALAVLGAPGQCAACVRQPPPLDAAFAAVSYDFPWSELIARYKFGTDPAWAAVFGELLLQTPGLSAHLAGLQPGDWLLPMPLSARRLQSRGYNQAWQLAKALGLQSGTVARCDAALLLRIKDTQPQTRLDRQARLQNVQGAFVVDPLRQAGLEGREVVLIDDVMTSGASLFAAARALRDAGAASVTGVVFARTE
jgi:ComF family protein